MAIIKKFASYLNLTNFQVFQIDKNLSSDYFRITELESTLTGGKNGFLIEGSEYLKETTEIKIEILDVEGNPVYFEPGDGIPEYYEGTSKLISVHVYDDTPIGIGKITILGELKNYIATDGSVLPIPDEWRGVYNVKWEREFQINKNLENETRVRFYKRPLVTITELVKPIFSKTIPTVTKTGYVHGISEIPPSGTDITSWRAGTNYKLKLTSGSWDRDVDENTISVTSPTFSSKIIEILNDREVLVNIPYSPNNIVSNFTSGSYSITYSDFNNEIIGESALTGSFAKIDITRLKTFVGDVARVKVFRKSRNQVGDFQFVQESKLESSELLRDITTQNDTELSYGRFDESNLSTYWVSSSNDHPLSIDSSVLSQAVKFDYNNVAGGVQQLITSESISLSTDVEYTLNFKTLLSGSLTTNKSIRAFFSSSNFTQDFLTISGSAIYTTRQDISKNIISENTGNAKLVFEVKGDDWYISNASLKNAQETSFSPDEFILIQDIPRKTASETFDFRFEFYDINNNYIPVDVTAVGVFDGGNDFPSSGKLLTFESDRNAFRFSSGSVQNPTGQQIQLKVSQNNLTGSVTFASSAFDVDGNYLNPSDYTQYPGLLTSVNPAGGIITINNFTGSRSDNSPTPFVGSVVYTASLENLQEFETVYRLEDGDNAPQLIVTSNANQFIYEPTTLSPKPSGQNITVRAQRKNLASLVTPITINSGSNRPPLNFVETVNGIDSYTISATQFSSSFSANSFDEVTYSFTGSDVFGNSQTDEITLSKVINFDAVSIVLSNESTAFQAKSTGQVLGGFAPSSGSVQMFIGGTQIQHIDGLAGQKNAFDIISASGDNVTPTDDTPNTANYSISDFETNKDSGSLTLDIKYLAGDNSTSQSFQKVVSYTKSKKAVPTVLTKISPSTQTINSSSLGFETPQTMEVIVQEGGDEYTFDSSNLSGGGDALARKFNINSLFVDSGSISNSNNILTFGSLTSSFNGIIGSASLDYVDSEGTYVTGKKVRFDLSVSKIGVDGVNGASGSDAKAVSLTSTKYAIVYDGDGNLFPASQPYTLTATAQNFTTPEYEFLEDGVSLLSGSTDNTLVVPTDSGSLPTAGASRLYEIRVKEQGEDYDGVFDNIDVFGVQSGSDAFTVFLTNEAHVFSATSESVVTSDLSDGSFEVRFFRGSQQYNSGSTGKTYSVSATTSNIVLSQSLESNNQAKFTPTSVSGDSGSASITITDNNTSQTFDKQYSFTLSKEGINGQDGEDGEDGEDGQDGADGANGVVINISPTSQTIKRSNSGTYDTPTKFTVTVQESGSLLTHQTGTGTPATSKYTITSLSNGTLSAGSGTTSPDITPTTPSTTAGLTTTFNITYTDGKGNTSSALAQSHVVSVVLDGTTGPGIVHTGEWEAGRAYQYADGLSDGDGRIDTVLYSGTYYAATSAHTSTNNTNASTGVPGSGPWESLGTQDLFVAAKIAIFEDSFVQNTLNVGTNNNGGVSSANITLAGASNNPYISIGQSGTIGSQGYDIAGIFIGQDSSTSKLSLKNSSGNRYLKWDGSSLEIAGSINITGGSAATSLSSLNDTTQSLQTDLNSVSSSVSIINDTTSSLENPTSYAFGGDAFALATNTAASGLNLTSQFLGYHNGTSFQTYMANNGDFYLGGTSGALTWDHSTSTLNIEGNITVTNTGDFAPTDAEANDPSQDNPANYSFGPDALFDLTSFTPSSAGLYLGSTNMGYYNSGWKTYMNNSGDFFLDGQSGDDSLSWDSSAGTLTVSGSIYAENGTFSGDLVGSTIGGGTINVPATSPLFTVTSAGQLSAVNAELSGSINAQSGEIGGWKIGSSTLYSPTTGQIRMSLAGGSNPNITAFDSSGNENVVINSGTSLSSLGAGSATVNNGTYNQKTTTLSTPPASTGTSFSNTDLDPGEGNSAVNVYANSVPVGNFTVTAQLQFPQTTGWAAKFTSTNYDTGGATLNSIYHYVKVGFYVSTSSSPYTTKSAITNNALYISPTEKLIQQTENSPGSTTTHYLPFNNQSSSYSFTLGGTVWNNTSVQTVYFHTYTYNYYLNALSANSSHLIDWDVQIQNPKFSAITLSSNVSRTELCGGGLQVVSSTDNYVLMERQTGGGLSANSVMLDVGGSIEATGNITANASDERLKNILGLIESPLDKIKQLKGIRFNWNETAKELANHKTDEEHIGLIAQDVQKVLPQIVKQSPIGKHKDENYLTIWYEKLVPLLVESIKELSEKVDKLEEDNNKLKDGN